jgi:hypothetical protein
MKSKKMETTMKGRKFKEAVTKDRLEVIYTVICTFTRYDGELIAKCNRTINNITFDGSIIPNDCGRGTIAVSNLQKFQEI